MHTKVFFYKYYRAIMILIGSYILLFFEVFVRLKFDFILLANIH